MIQTSVLGWAGISMVGISMVQGHIYGSPANSLLYWDNLFIRILHKPSQRGQSNVQLLVRKFACLSRLLQAAHDQKNKHSKKLNNKNKKFNKSNINKSIACLES